MDTNVQLHVVKVQLLFFRNNDGFLRPLVGACFLKKMKAEKVRDPGRNTNTIVVLYVYVSCYLCTHATTRDSVGNIHHSISRISQKLSTM